MALNEDGFAGLQFAGLLEARAASDPDGIYARFNGAPLTFGRLAGEAAAFAAELAARGIGPGDRVAVMLRNSPATLAVVFGLMRAGIAWVPVNVQQRGDGLAYLLSHAAPKLLVVERDLLAIVQEATGGRGPELMLNGTPAALQAVLASGHPFDGPLPGPDATAAIMYTSGTTGRPKGVIVSHRMLRLASEAVSRVSVARPGDVFFVWEPLYHIGGAQLMLLPMTHGITLAMVDRFSASRFWGQVAAEEATHIHYLGGILQILLKQPEGPQDRAHKVRIAWGGGCPPEIWRRFEERFGVEIRECYGMTEASSITTFNDSGAVGSVGAPLPWFKVLLLDETGEPVGPGARGEIVVETSLPGALFEGYLDNPEATAKALRGGRLHTGDLGSYDAEGNLLFHGRMTDSVRCRGENVSAWEVEHVAAEHPDVEDCAMIGVAADVGEQDIKLFVKPRPGSRIDAAALSRWLGARLASYQNPRYIAVVTDFERTASQRIMKHKLPTSRDDCWDRLAMQEA